MIIKIYEQRFDIGDNIFTFIFIDEKKNKTYYINQFHNVDNFNRYYNSFEINDIKNNKYDYQINTYCTDITCNLINDDPLKIIKKYNIFNDLLYNSEHINIIIDEKNMLDINTIKNIYLQI